ncbi:MAG: DUF4350 domain-containing protein [Candidatus Adiutrix sp.]|jgi:hypothetical protein|nr:DUF4350 domain-containing protein [Candidatus Adiutrix sp.]
MKSAPFSRPAVVLLPTLAVALLALSIILGAFEKSPPRAGDRSRPGAYSISALGYAGFYDTLKRLGRPVLRGLSGLSTQVGADGTLIVAEPDLSRMTEAERGRILEAPRLLLVLPKWGGRPDPVRPAWLEAVYYLPPGTARQTLALAGVEAEVRRQPWPELWAVNEIGPRPSGSGRAQLIRSEKIRPLVASEEGFLLLGEIPEGPGKIWILADPDLMNNQGLPKGDNLSFMLALVDRLRGWNSPDPKGPLVFDETVHGLAAARWSPLKLLFDFPLVLVTVLLGLTALLAVLAGGGRFGAPLKAAPGLDFGKKQLIDNSARLLDQAGRQAGVLKRYVLLSLRSAGRQLHAPAGLDDRALALWLDRVGRARGLGRSCAEILENLSEPFETGPEPRLERLFACAREIYRWKGEILNGSAAHRRHGQGHPH